MRERLVYEYRWASQYVNTTSNGLSSTVSIVRRMAALFVILNVRGDCDYGAEYSASVLAQCMRRI